MAPTDVPIVTEAASRRAALAMELQRRDLGAAIVSSEANFVYLTGYQTPSWANRSRPMAIVVTADGSTYAVLSAAEARRLTDAAPGIELRPYLEPVAYRNGSGVRVDFSGSAAKALISALRDCEPRRVGVELSPHAAPVLSFEAVSGVCEKLGLVTEDIAETLIDQRLLKSPWEIERIRWAATVLDNTFARFAEKARIGMTERELAGLLTRLGTEEGADRVGYLIVVADARRPLLGPPTDTAWAAGSVLHVDVGLVVDGYWADFCRELVGADPSDPVKHAYDGVRAAVQAGIEAARGGVLAGDVARAIISELPTSGSHVYGRVGHSIGVELTEPPSLHLDDTTLLEPCMTLCIEPAASFDGVGQLVGEAMIVVRDGDAELLSPQMPGTLVEVGPR